MKFFVGAKAWQMFLVLMASMTAGIFIGPFPPTKLSMTISALIYLGVVGGWLCSIAIFSNRRIDPSLKKSPAKLLVGLGFALLYILLSPWLWPDIETGKGGPGPAVVLPLHLIAMAGVIHALAFSANRLTALERGKKVSFFEYSGPFFLLWFFPIGVWFIQPRVNRLLLENA